MQAAINAAGNLLPDDLPVPPIYSKVNPADTPILTLARHLAHAAAAQARTTWSTRASRRRSRSCRASGLVSIAGGQRPAVRIQVNPKALAAYGLSLDDVRTAIAAANVNQAKGSFDGPTRASTIDANDQLNSADEYRTLIIAYKQRRADAACRTSPTSIDGAENTRLAAWADDTPAVILNVQRQPGANVIEVVDRVQAAAAAAAGVAAGRRGRDAAHRPHRRPSAPRCADVQFELLLAVALVVMVIFLFLRNAAGDGHPERRGAAVAGRHVRRHVPGRASRSTT